MIDYKTIIITFKNKPTKEEIEEAIKEYRNIGYDIMKITKTKIWLEKFY